MAKAPKSLFICQDCGATETKWTGKCPSCGGWNTFAEQNNAAAAPGSGLASTSKGRVVELQGLDGPEDEAPRMSTGNAELDRVTGGGIVPGSATLLGGEPGIGKSTLLLQVAAAMASSGPAGGLLLGRGSRRTSEIACQEAGAGGCAGRPRLGDQPFRHPGDAQ